MSGTEARKELPPTSSGSGCNCCSTDAPEDSVTGTGGADYAIEGLTCAHCVATLRKAVTALDGVEAAFVELVRAAARAWSFPDPPPTRPSGTLSPRPATA